MSNAGLKRNQTGRQIMTGMTAMAKAMNEKTNSAGKGGKGKKTGGGGKRKGC